MNFTRPCQWLRITTALFAVIAVHGCGTVTNLQAVDDTASRPDLSSYERVVVGNFIDRATETRAFRDDAQGVEKKTRYAADVEAGTNMFPNYIVAELSKLGSFADVVRGTEPQAGDLYIDGDITRYSRGNAAAKYLIGFGAGSTNFDAVVRLHDGPGSETLGTIVVDKNSLVIGGALSVVQTLDGFMRRGAEKVARELTAAKNQPE